MTDHDEALARLLREQRSPSFGPGFADRVLRRVAEEEAGFLAGIRPAEWFGLAAAAVIVAVALAAFSLGATESGSQSALEAMFGLPPLTADSVYDAGALFTPVEGEAG
jgi:hypothetical protein